MADPLVSVIMPYYNAGAFIDGAIESIRRQQYAPLEIILIDDGSTDDIAQRVKTLGKDIVYIRQENQGPAAARNAGIRRAKGEVIAFLDADDRWPEGKLEKQVGRLQADPALGIVTGRIQYILLEGAADPKIDFDDGNTLVHVHLGAAVVRRSVFEATGMFNETLRFHEDHDWYLRVREQGINMVILKDITLLYQRHPASVTHEKPPLDTAFMSMLKRSIDRRKAASGGKTFDLKSFKDYDDA
jgi:glycosyltransferase involved in cell wall biosynthesis